MNIPESNHNAADLGIPYMDTTQNFFRPTPQQRLDFQVRPNENFGLKGGSHEATSGGNGFAGGVSRLGNGGRLGAARARGSARLYQGSASDDLQLERLLYRRQRGRR